MTAKLVLFWRQTNFYWKFNRFHDIYAKFFTDKEELLAAKTYLEHAASNNLAEFLKALSDVLVNASNSLVARQAAGLQLKNQLTSKDATIGVQYQQRWLSFPEPIREYIKKNVSW